VSTLPPPIAVNRSALEASSSHDRGAICNTITGTEGAQLGPRTSRSGRQKLHELLVLGRCVRFILDVRSKSSILSCACPHPVRCTDGRDDAECSHKVTYVMSAGPPGLRASPTGEPDVLLGNGGDGVECPRRRRYPMGFNQRCGAGIRQISVCHPLRDNPVYHADNATDSR